MLALAVAFWSQIESPASAGVTVMLLAQPLRGQALSKAFYRVMGTMAGAVVALLLIAMFGQERRLLLGGCALWMALCAYVGTMRRGFRAYGALLAGYVVALIAVAHIDAPQNAFHVTIARVSGVMIGVASITTIALLSGAPHVWQRLTHNLQRLASQIRHEARLALDETTPALTKGPAKDKTAEHEPAKDETTDLEEAGLETIALSSTVFSLTSQVHDSRTELNKGRLRARGAQVCLISMVTTLSCCRSLFALMNHGRPALSPAILTLTRADSPTPPQRARKAILTALLSRLEKPRLETVQLKRDKPPQQPETTVPPAPPPAPVPTPARTAGEAGTTGANDAPSPLTPAEAWRLERTASLMASRHDTQTGLDTLLKAAPLGPTSAMSRFDFHPDRTAAFINAMRVLLCFSVAAALFIGSGIPHAATALSQCALLLCLAILQPDTAAFGRGILIGTPLGIITAAITSFLILPHISTMAGMAVILLLQVAFTCLLIINPKTSAIGTHYGSFFFVFLGLDNHHDFNLAGFVDRNTFYLCAAGLTACFLILFLPTRPRRARLRIALSIARELEAQLGAKPPAFSPALLSRKYDRLHQLYTLSQTISRSTSQRMGQDNNQKTGQKTNQAESRGRTGKAAWRICARFVSLADLTTALARLEQDLTEARQYPALAPLVKQMQDSLAAMTLFSLAEALPHMAETMLEQAALLEGEARAAAILCGAGLEEVRFLLQQNKAALRHYRIGRARW